MAAEMGSIYDRFTQYLKTDEKGLKRSETAGKEGGDLQDVPDFLRCRISDEIMNDPVIIQSGFTYERKMILLHFYKNGNFDPITREEVDPMIMIGNIYLKKAADDFLVNNPWAYQYIPGEDIYSVKM